jgi:two-component system sensor histidine kinase/response regulator
MKGKNKNMNQKKSEQAGNKFKSDQFYFGILFKDSPLAIVITDPYGKITNINHKFTRLFGFNKKECIGKDLDKLISSHDSIREARLFTNKTISGEKITLETKRYHKNGKSIMVSVLTSPIILNNKVEAVYGIYRDITDRKQMEEALIKEKSYLEQLFESAQEAIVMTENNGRIMRINKEFTKIFGYRKKESIGKFIDDLIAPKEFYKEASNITRATAHGKKTILETCRKKKNGSLIHVSVMGSPITVNDKQEAVYAIYRDITERKQSEEQLFQAKEAALSANIAKSEFLANMSHEIRTPMNGIIGMTELALDTDLNPIQREYLEAIKSSTDSLMTIINDVLDFSRIEAKKIELESIHFNLRDFTSDVVSSLSMLAEKKGLEMLYHISSETPIYVKGDPGRIRQILVNLLGNALKFTEKGEIVTLVKVSAFADKKVYLQFSVSDTGIGIPKEKQKSIFQSFTQADGSTTRKYGGTGLGLSISSSLVDLMNGKIWIESKPNKGTTFYFTIGLEVGEKTSDLPKPANKDELKGLSVLIVDDNATNRRILKDILTNWGLKPESAPDGQSALRIMKKFKKTGKFFSIILVDVQMPGMDGFSLVEKISSEFKLQSPTIMMLTSLGVRGDATRCQQLGISAYLVKPVRQAELLEAILLVHGKNKMKKKSPGVITRHTIREKHQTFNILLAEDNIINQKIVQRFLEKEGHHVSIAENGKKALSILKNEKFDLILMDIQMPQMDGFEATTIIRGQETSSKTHIPIIAMTGHALKGDKERCLSAGMDEYISKPISFEKLNELINQLLK